MGSFSIWHWLIVLILVLSWVIPVALILRKAGYSAWWVFLSLIPMINVIGIWLFAMAEWPRTKSKI
jgi:hypothetical protein